MRAQLFDELPDINTPNQTVIIKGLSASHKQTREKQGQTVHKLQIATFWDINIYICM